MFIPLDYQFDFLKALHLIYYAFPPPVRVGYYGFSNRHQLDNEVYSKLQGFYTKPLDDTSIARFFKVQNLPFYFIQGGEASKQQQAGEFGNVFNQQEITGVVPMITNLEFINEEYIVFTSSGVTRLFEIANIEISNINEENPLRLYKLNLKLSKYSNTTELDNRTQAILEYSYETSKIYPVAKFNYIFKTLFLLLNVYILKVDKANRNPYVDDFLSKLYTDYKLIYNILLGKYTFNFVDMFKDYSQNTDVYFLENPYGYTEIPDLQNLSDFQIMLNDVNTNSFQNHPYLWDDFISHYETLSLTMSDVMNLSSDMEYIIAIYFITKQLNELI